MIEKSISNRAFFLWALVAGLEGILAFFFIVREPSEAESAIAFGLSLQRLLIATSVFLLVSFFFVVALAHYYQIIRWNEKINNKPKSINYLLVSVFVLELIVLHLLFLIPEYHFPVLLGYLPRIKPVLIWFAFLYMQTLLFLVYFGGISLENLKGWQGKWPMFVVLVMIGIIWGGIVLTGIGIIPDEFYWNVAGVPILAGQVWLAIGITLFLSFLYKRFLERKDLAARIASLFFVGFWFAAAVIWIKTPLAPTFNAPGPYFPSREFYPFVDTALFDLGAQSAIYGRGLFFGGFIDRALLSGFLALLHLIFGQKYLLVVNAQSAIFAVMPALLFLLGKKLHSNAAGFMVAILSVLKVSNAIAGGKLISTSHPKLMLTEFPTGIILVLISLFLTKWLLGKNSGAHPLAGFGALLGVGILLRHNVFFMLPVMLMFGVFVWRLRWEKALRDVSLVLVAFFITISPWMWRNQRVAGEALFFLTQFNRVIEERYQPESHYENNKRVSNTFSRTLTISANISRQADRRTLDLDQYQFIPKHFVNNILTSVLTLPPSPVWDDIRHVVDGYPYWGRMENTTLRNISVRMGVFLAFNLIILSIGIGTTWNRVRFVSLVPLMVFLFYNLANAFARTSGGRYIVPVDWVIYFYYAVGLVEILRYFIAALSFHTGSFFEPLAVFRPMTGETKYSWIRTGLLILPFFLIVAMLPVIEFMSPGDQPTTTASLFEQLDQNSFFIDSGISRQALEQFLEHPDAVLMSGRGLYPRYYPHEQGEPFLPGQMTVYTAREYPRLVFTLLLPTMDKPVLLPIDEPRLYFPDAAEVIVGGCQVGQSPVLTSYFNYINAAFVVILDEPGAVYTRVPNAILACPLREPVCDNNRNCN